jgi:Uma2 family endonuclease
MTLAAPPIEQRFVLEDVDWQFYEDLLERVGDRHIFITYDRGRLELMSPSWEHAKRGRRIGLLISILAEELEIPIEGGGSTTFRREDLQRGLEPDECFYVKNVDRVRGKRKIDLSVDPPPDLVIEVEISRRMLARLPLYEALGVPELWRDDGQHVRVFTLGTDGRYHEAEHSPSFPMLPVEQLSRLLETGIATDEMNWMRNVRRWVKKNLSK